MGTDIGEDVDTREDRERETQDTRNGSNSKVFPKSIPNQGAISNVNIVQYKQGHS
jgi:hypothetical protein